MTISTWLKEAVIVLQQSGIQTARLDALILLGDETGYERGYLLAHPELNLSESKTTKLKKLLSVRAQHMPLAYIRGKAEFYGREFIVGPGVLVPRPETEAMVELFNQLMNDLISRQLLPPDGKAWRVADVGTGSGALGITAALEQPKALITLLEIDESAIDIAKANVISLSTDVGIQKSDLVQGIADCFNILLCNLPYVPDDFPINQAASHEPSIAIFGGIDGLDLYRRLFDQIKIVANKPLYILTEALPQSHNVLTAIAIEFGYQLAKTNDFVQLFRHETTV